jgi:hypothetical protein
MKYALLSLCLMLFCLATSQAQQTSSFRISGEIRAEKTIDRTQIQAFESTSLQDFAITNHAGEPRGTLTGLQGFPILRILEQLEFNSPSPKQMSEFYFVFEASDGYKVVFSWNELFNNPLGNQVYLITAANGQSLDQMEDGLLIISASDLRTGRRHVKNLTQIRVMRVN